MHGRFFIHVDVRGDVIEVIAYAVQQNAEEQQGVGEVLFGTAVNKEAVANGGGDQASSKTFLIPKRLVKNGRASMKKISENWPRVIQPVAFFIPTSVR